MPRQNKSSAIADLRTSIASGTKELSKATRNSTTAKHIAHTLLEHVEGLSGHSSFLKSITETEAHLVWLGMTNGSKDYRLMEAALHCIHNNVQDSDLDKRVRTAEHHLRDKIERRTAENRKTQTTAMREKFSWFRPAPA